MSGLRIADTRPAWQKPETKSVFDSPIISALRILAHLGGLDDLQSQALGVMMPIEAGPSGGLIGAMQKRLKAYHGSPHDFERFDMSKIGTGQGAQSYGRGLYFAEKPETAEAYRKVLSKSQIPQEVASGQYPSVAAMNIDRVKKGLDPIRPGHTYEVAINADAESFIDWDKPLSQQTQAVKRAIAADPLMQQRIASASTEHTGRTLIRSLAGADPEQRLKQAGIPGIKYLDEGSRAAGEGSRNYVVFDDNLIEILRKYGLLAPASGPAIHQAVKWLATQPKAREK